MAEHLFLHYSRPRPAWYNLTEEERARLVGRWESLDECSAKSGARHLGTWSVRGQGDYSLVRVWVFAAAEDVLAYWGALVEADYPEWFATSNVLGAPVPDGTSVVLGLAKGPATAVGGDRAGGAAKP